MIQKFSDIVNYELFKDIVTKSNPKKLEESYLLKFYEYFSNISFNYTSGSKEIYKNRYTTFHSWKISENTLFEIMKFSDTTFNLGFCIADSLDPRDSFIRNLFETTILKS